MCYTYKYTRHTQPVFVFFFLPSPEQYMYICIYICILQFNIEPKPIPSTYELHLSHVIYARLSRPALTTLKMRIGAVGMGKDAFRVCVPTDNGFYVFFKIFLFLFFT